MIMTIVMVEGDRDDDADEERERERDSQTYIEEKEQRPEVGGQSEKVNGRPAVLQVKGHRPFNERAAAPYPRRPTSVHPHKSKATN
jgi:hypothetical protein